MLREGFPLYLESRPSVDPFEVDPDPAVISTDNWKIADLVIGTGNLPDDPEDKKRAVQWLSTLSTDWKKDFNDLRTRYRNLVRAGCTDNRIIITSDKRFKRVSECERPAPSNHSPTSQKPSIQSRAQDEVNPVTAKVEGLFGKFAPGDPVQAEFEGLPIEFGIPETSLCRVIDDKVKEKKQKNYHIQSPAALLGFVRSGLPGWIAQHGDKIELDRRFEVDKGASLPEPDETPEQARETKLNSLRRTCYLFEESGPDNVNRGAWLKEFEQALGDPDVTGGLRERVIRFLDRKPVGSAHATAGGQP